MAGSFTFSPKPTFNGKEAMSLQDAIIEQAYNNPNINRIFTIYQGIVAKQQIVFLKNFFKISQVGTTCGESAITTTVPTSEKFWNPSDIKMHVSQCWADFRNMFVVWGMKNGINKYDLTDTDLETYKLQKMAEGGLEDMTRVVWFGDTAISHIAASPAGTLTRSADIVNYNWIDGIWKQIFTGVAGGTITRYTITENAGVNYAAQLALNASRAYLTFKALYENADSRLRAAQNKVILCTDSLYMNWLAYKETITVDNSFNRQEKEYVEDVFRSVTLIPYSLWDRWIRADFDNTITTTYYLPHRAIMTTKENLGIGMDDETGVSNLRSHLDMTTDYYHIKGAYKLDAKLLEEYMITVAY